ARVDPRRSSVGVVKRSAHDRGAAVSGKRDGDALSGVANRAGADQLVAQLGPDTIAAGEDPRRPAVRVVSRSTHDGSVAVGRKRDGDALSGVSNRTAADQFVALLGPNAIAAGIDPRRPRDPVVSKPAHDGSVAVGGKRDGPALLAESNREGADQLRSLLRELR